MAEEVVSQDEILFDEVDGVDTREQHDDVDDEFDDSDELDDLDSSPAPKVFRLNTSQPCETCFSGPECRL